MKENHQASSGQDHKAPDPEQDSRTGPERWPALDLRGFDAFFQKLLECGEQDRPAPEPPARHLPPTLPHYTFAEAREIHRALGDAPSQAHWTPLEGEIALRHALPKDKLQTKFIPSTRLLEFRGARENPPGEGARELLCAELGRLDFDANLLFAAALSLAIESGSVTTTLDELGRAIGWQPRSSRQKQENRRKLWSRLLLLDSLRVIGRRKGSYKDPDTKEKRDLATDDDLLHIAGTTGENQEGIPEEVTLSVGPWIQRMRGDKKVLTYLGDLRTLAGKPRGRFCQRLAVKIGLCLQQLWRERAAFTETTIRHTGESNRLSIRFVPFTRREILSVYGQEAAREVVELLQSKNPGVARAYWEAALSLLNKWGIVGYYREMKPLPSGREGLQEYWYHHQPLEIRPGPPLARDVKGIKQAKGAADRARKRQRSAQSKGNVQTPHE